MLTRFHFATATFAVGVVVASGSASALSPCESAELVSTGAFGAKLLTAASGDGTRNALVSPLGIGTMFEMVAPGANPPARDAIQAMFGASAGPVDNSDGGGLSCQLAGVLEDAVSDAVAVQAAHAAFADLSLDLFPEYVDELQNGFGANVERLDFEDEDSVGRINAWFEEATSGGTPHLVSRLDPADMLVLANAMHFEGEWERRFDPQNTVPALFQAHAGPARQIPTMHAKDLPAMYREDENFQAIALPYGGGRFELVAVLPHAELDVTEALQRLTADPSWLGGRNFRRARGTLALPRLALDVEASLLPALRTLWLDAALDDPQAFAGIAEPAPKLSRVLHRATLVLDERGTEATAATAAIMAIRTAEARFNIHVNRPFALAVRHRDTGAVLFAAWVDDPVAGKR